MKPIDKFEIEPGVTVYLYPEEDADWDAECFDDPEMQARIRRGDVKQVVVVVKLFDKTGNVEGSSCIGAVTIGLDDHKQEVRDTLDAYEMIEEARQDLAAKLKAIVEQDNSYASLIDIAKAYRNLLRTSAHTDGEVATYHHIEATIAKIEGQKS